MKSLYWNKVKMCVLFFSMAVPTDLRGDTQLEFSSWLYTLRRFMGEESNVMLPAEVLELFGRMRCNTCDISDGELQSLGIGLYLKWVQTLFEVMAPLNGIFFVRYCALYKWCILLLLLWQIYWFNSLWVILWINEAFDPYLIILAVSSF